MSFMHKCFRKQLFTYIIYVCVCVYKLPHTSYVIDIKLYIGRESTNDKADGAQS